ASLVREIVRAGLEAVLVHRLGLAPAAAEGWIHRGEPPERSPDLRQVTVLDPAVGSGAFLLGALDELTRLRCTVGEGPACAIRRDVVAHSLFGVDLSLTAVRLAELRLWLALIADVSAEPNDREFARIAPLPNLDGHVRQGDALVDPLTLARALGSAPAPATPTPELERLSSARRTLFGLAGPAKRDALATLARAEAALARGLFRAAVAALERRGAELIAAAKDRDLFGRRRGLTGDERALLRRLRASRRELRAAATRLERDGGAPFFAFESHFGDGLAWGGFDLVAGNPPWVRGERVPMRVREALATRYATWRPARGRGFAHLPDLAVAFVERALELAAPGGSAALLVPAKLASSGYAEPLRRRLAEGARIERVVPSPAAAGAFAAAVYPMVLVITRAEPTGREQVATALGARSATPLIPQRALAGDGPWILARDAALAPHLERLGRRCDYRAGPPWQLFRTALAFAPCRVVWPDLARRLAAVVLDPELVPLNTVYGIATREADDAYALAALFNSRWLTAPARLHADPARGGF